MRVLMITSEWPRVPWGTAQFIARQATFLRAAGVDVEVFAFQGNANPLRYAGAWFEVRRRLAREHFDLIHAQFGQCALLALPKRMPMVITFRGDDLQGILGVRNGRVTLAGRLLRAFCRWSAHRADAVILVSAHMQRDLGNGNGTPVHVVPSGLDFELFRPMPQAAARARLGLPQDERLVLFVGNPDLARKRYALARDAVALLPALPRTRLVVGWHVPHEQIPEYMAACDALVFTSSQEGSPNAVKEALACNLPVVSVPVGDVAERLEGIEGCELCADDRPETIAAALERVLARGARIAGRAAVSHLDEKLITQRVIAIYGDVLKGRAGA
ncbi:MAG TPA: glycosyltransferase family 4 protein [Myxococcales bacterium]|nr:glycosyltransferase family 4 protein [Myxococcales bacterium]